MQNKKIMHVNNDVCRLSVKYSSVNSSYKKTEDTFHKNDKS